MRRIAGSFSQTYKRNAFNNGFICLECPQLIDDLRARFAGQADEARTILAGGIEVDYTNSTITWSDTSCIPREASDVAACSRAAG